MKLLGQPRGQVAVDARALLGGAVADLARDNERPVLGELAPLQSGQREGEVVAEPAWAAAAADLTRSSASSWSR